MFKNYILTALRNLWRNKVFSVINILGLAFGITCSILILLWVQDEYSVDAFHKNGAQLYTVYERQFNDDKVDAGYYTPGPLGDELKKKIPEVVYASTSRQNNDISTFELNDKILKEEGNFAGEDFFKMFSYPLLLGNTQIVLNSPSAIVISRKMADDFFGSPESAMGKSIRYENEKNYIVTGVFENLPANTSDKFDYLISWQSFIEDNAWAKQWDNNSPRTYVMLRPDANGALVENKIKNFLKGYNKYLGPHLNIELGLQRFSDMYLHSEFKNGYAGGGRIEYVQIFSIVAIIILLIACINFMNLTTARSIKRAKEIGVRKVTGAVRASIIKQFMSETLLFVFIAVVIALVLTALVLPAFNSFTGKEIKLPVSDGNFWFELLTLTLITGFASGCYPALFLSSFSPIKVLKGTLKHGTYTVFLRKGLVVFQFILSVGLIIGTIVISQQVNYIQTKDIGFDRENLIYVPLEGDLTAKYEVFKDEALKAPGIAGVTRITSAPTQIGGSTWGVDWTGKDPDSKPLFTTAEVGYEFVQTMKLPLLQGRDFSKDFAADSANYLVNEKALERIGYKDPVGKPLSLWGVKGHIVGVVKDFHFNSLHDPVSPLIIKLGEHDDWGYALVRTGAGKTQQALASLATVCKTLNPQFTFEYQFADDDYESLYKNEQVIDKLADYFSFLAIFISCLGLLGLAIFSAEQRTKEIGIRKVVGASVSSIAAMVTKDILKLVFISAIIASPLAWYVMNKWLQNYAYRVNIKWWIFPVAGLTAMFIALITVSFHAIKAGVANPVKSLRTE
jgi:ABC-type antimicrobial peptide transport system permease subunit